MDVSRDGNKVGYSRLGPTPASLECDRAVTGQKMSEGALGPPYIHKILDRNCMSHDDTDTHIGNHHTRSRDLEQEIT